MQNKLLLLFFACLASISLIAAAVQPRIFGGTPATTGQFPAICKLTIQYDDATLRCGANIILDGFYLLTAAHCVEDRPSGAPTLISCLGGVTDLLSDSPNKQIRYSLNHYIHADYNAAIIRNDVALIQLSEPFRISSTVKEVLPALSEPAIGTNVYAAGWGLIEDYSLPNDLLWTILQFLDDDVCAADFPAIFEPFTQVCAGTTTGNDTCGGDSGGPIYTSSDPYSNSDDRLLGVTSYGGDCASLPGAVYSSVPNLARDWIKAILSDCDCYENCKAMKAACYYKYGKEKCSSCYKDYLRCNKMCDHRNDYTF